MVDEKYTPKREQWHGTCFIQRATTTWRAQREERIENHWSFTDSITPREGTPNSGGFTMKTSRTYTNTILAVAFALSTVIIPAVAQGADLVPMSGQVDKELVSVEQNKTKVNHEEPVGWLGLLDLLRF